MTDGAKVTATVQFDPTASVAGQLGAAVNPPLAEMLPKFNGVPPKLATVTVCEPLVPMFWVKFKWDGERLIAEGRGLGKGIGVIPKT